MDESALSTLREEEEADEYYDNNDNDEDALSNEYEEESLHDEFENQDDGANNWRQRKPNQFDNLCDGVLESLSLLHSALENSLSLKDELLQERLPASFLVELSVTSTKLYRSVSDMNTPIYELIRLVRLYSTPWQEKSAALKKLHEDYNRKARQLDVAVKRLQLVDGQAKHMAKERRILNWEKLFSKVTCAKGHGRRWKFLIDNFKKKAKSLADPSLIDTILNDDFDVGEEDNMIAREDTTLINVDNDELGIMITPTPDDVNVSDNEGGDNEIGIDDDDEDDENDLATTTEQASTTPGSKTKLSIAEIIKAEVRDVAIDTNDPEYECQLKMRLYKPKGIDETQLSCSIRYANQSYKTSVLDPVVVVLENNDNNNDTDDKPKEENVNKSRRLIGRNLGKSIDDTNKEEKEKKLSTTVAAAPLYDECILNNVQKSKDEKNNCIKIAVYSGTSNNALGIATIDIDELEGLDLPTIYVTDSSSPIDTTDIDKLEPLNYPLFSLSSDKQCGQQPLVCYWIKWPIAKRIDRSTESDTIYDIVYDLTGFDMRETTKDDLHADKESVALSVQRFTPEVTTNDVDMIPKGELDKAKIEFERQFEQLQKEYESRLDDLLKRLEREKEQDNKQVQTTLDSGRSKSASSNKSVSNNKHHPQQDITRMSSTSLSSPSLNYKPEKIERIEHAMQSQSKQKMFNMAMLNNRNLPKSFLDRLSYFNEESLKHKQTLTKDQLSYEKAINEERLAAEYKLHRDHTEDVNQLEDVTLPGVFQAMPNRVVFNPRASKYFHATGSRNSRLTQPPTTVELPPMPKSKLPAVLNLFDLASASQHENLRDNNYRQNKRNEWLVDKYIIMQEEQRQQQQQPQRQAIHEIDYD